MNGRILYVDKLKGLAILFMVMGHVVQISFDTSDVTFVRFYSSFHMPIFFFLSGSFVYKHIKNYDSTEFCHFFVSKFKRIMLPFISIGSSYVLLFRNDLVCLYDGSFGGYWFLPALFFCMLFDILVDYFLHYTIKK